ncbi:MAG: hypothetical protein IPI46_12795 [Bacteroidetes bacterium]|nr:hypothetical protein [Bacteroidota bacterium]
MRKILLAALFVSVSAIISCSEGSKKPDHESAKSENTEDCETSTIKDPNEVKPMALMMRTMADYCDTMRLKINKGEKVDSIAFPLMPFWSAEPTDSSVLETLFFDNAIIIQNAWRKLMSSPENQAANYTAVVDACVHCHSSYCSGPLRRIRKLKLDYKAE